MLVVRVTSTIILVVIPPGLWAICACGLPSFFLLLPPSTGLAYLVGNPNFDSMSGKYYARFYVKHSDNSDSYLRKAYTNLDLHTDGTYVKEKTDWLIMTKMEEQGVSGGESVI